MSTATIEKTSRFMSVADATRKGWQRGAQTVGNGRKAVACWFKKAGRYIVSVTERGLITIWCGAKCVGRFMVSCSAEMLRTVAWLGVGAAIACLLWAASVVASLVLPILCVGALALAMVYIYHRLRSEGFEIESFRSMVTAPVAI